MPNKKVKLTDDEIKSIKEVQQGYQQLQPTIGSVHLRKHQLILQVEEAEKQLVELEVNFTQMRNDEVELLKNLEEKYGQGNLDMVSGEFNQTQIIGANIYRDLIQQVEDLIEEEDYEGQNYNAYKSRDPNYETIYKKRLQQIREDFPIPDQFKEAFI